MLDIMMRMYMYIVQQTFICLFSAKPIRPGHTTPGAPAIRGGGQQVVTVRGGGGKYVQFFVTFRLFFTST